MKVTCHHNTTAVTRLLSRKLNQYKRVPLQKPAKSVLSVLFLILLHSSVSQQWLGCTYPECKTQRRWLLSGGLSFTRDTSTTTHISLFRASHRPGAACPSTPPSQRQAQGICFQPSEAIGGGRKWQSRWMRQASHTPHWGTENEQCISRRKEQEGLRT